MKFLPKHITRISSWETSNTKWRIFYKIVGLCLKKCHIMLIKATLKCYVKTKNSKDTWWLIEGVIVHLIFLKKIFLLLNSFINVYMEFSPLILSAIPFLSVEIFTFFQQLPLVFSCLSLLTDWILCLLVWAWLVVILMECG